MKEWMAMVAEGDILCIVSDKSLNDFALTEACMTLIKENMEKEYS